MARPPGPRKSTWGERFEDIGWVADQEDVYDVASSINDSADLQSSGSASTSTLGQTESVDTQREQGAQFEWVRPASTRVDAYKYVPSDPEAYDSGTGNICVKFIKKGNRRLEYVYTNVPYHTYLNFHGGGSKGKFINATLNAMGYHEATDSDLTDYFQDI